MSAENSADVIEQAAEVVYKTGIYVNKYAAGQIARALHDAGLLANPADICEDKEVHRLYPEVMSMLNELRTVVSRVEALSDAYDSWTGGESPYASSPLQRKQLHEALYGPEHSSQKHHEMTLESVREQLLDIQHFLCAYNTTEGDGRPCDCKYIGVGHPSSEQTGCCELRLIIRSLS